MFVLRRLLPGLLALAALLAVACGAGEPAATSTTPPPVDPRVLAEENRIAQLEAERRAREASRARSESAAGTGEGGDAPAGSDELLSDADVRSFAQLERGLGAELGLVAGPVGSERGERRLLGSLRTGPAWSTIKLPIAVRVLAERRGSVPAADDSRIRRALTASSDAAAARLWARLERRHGGELGAASAVQEVLAAAGDRTTVVSTVGRGSFSAYGQTRWSLSAAQRFTAALARGCLADQRTTGRLLSLMADVVPAQRWGLGSAGPRARFKGGWGPGRDGRYLVRQVGVLELGSTRRPVAVAVAARAADGSFEGGRRALSALARWTAAHLDRRAVRVGEC